MTSSENGGNFRNFKSYLLYCVVLHCLFCVNDCLFVFAFMMTEKEDRAHTHKWTTETIPQTRKAPLFVDTAVKLFGGKPSTGEWTEAARTLQSCSALGEAMSEEMLVECAIPPVLLEMAGKVYIDDEMPVMVDKYEVPGRKTCSVDIDAFKSSYVPKMNKSAEELKKHKFSSEDEAFLVLCQMIRSFIPNLAAHIHWVYDGKEKRIVSYCCSSLNHRESKKPGDCEWHAQLEEKKVEENSYFCFTEIDSFDMHGETCISKPARFTTTEVTFQELFPPQSRSVVAKILKQVPVDQTTVSMRANRRKSFLNDVDRRLLTSTVKDLEIDPIVSSIPIEQVGKREEPNEAYRLLQFLTHIKLFDKAHAKAFFELDEKMRLCLSMMTFIWPEGIHLLESHSDAIFCDSMWGINEDGDHIMTIVVVNREEKLRLAASAIVFRENRKNWELFFSWVKECVKEFDPECIVTDGADYIHSAFRAAVKPNVLHASCWWHKNRTVKRMFGPIGAIAKSLQSMVYADSVEELVRREDEVLHMLQDLKVSGSNNASVKKSELQKLEAALNEINDHSFVSLPVFTGGTLSNSYAESINSRLRKVGLIAFKSRFASMQALRSYCKADAPSRKGFSTDREVLLRSVMCDDVVCTVSNGVLRHQAKQIEETTKKFQEGKCNILLEDEEKFVVQEKKLTKVLLIRREAKRVVVWKKEEGKPDTITCSCNALVYRGMPCTHIALVATVKNYKIPLACFNHRYWYLDSRDGGPEPVQCAPSSPPFPEEEDDDHPPDVENDEIGVIPSNEQHITEAHLNAVYGSEEEINIRGSFRSLELMLLGGFLPLTDYHQALDMVSFFKRTLQDKINELSTERQEAQVVVPHPIQPIGISSYKTRPLQVAQACAEAMKRNSPSNSPQRIGPPAKKPSKSDERENARLFTNETA